MEFLKNSKDISAFIDKFDVFVLDCDGVLWRGAMHFPKIKDTLEMLQKRGKRIFIQTNNNSVAREDYVEKLKKKIGFPVSKENILTSSYLCALYLNSIGFKKTVYVKGFKVEFDGFGIKSVGYDKFAGKKYEQSEFVNEFELDDSIGAVVVGYSKTFNHYQLAHASCLARYAKGCLFMASNPDTTFPLVRKNGDPILVPGTGSIVGSFVATLGKEPIICGKPNPYGIDSLVKKFGLKKEKICFVGDRLNTDIKMANKAGIASLLVLTGVTEKSDLEKHDVKVCETPSYILDKFTDLLCCL